MEKGETVLALKTLQLIEKITRNDNVLFQKEADSFGIEECLDYSDSDSSDNSSLFQSLLNPKNSPNQQAPQQQPQQQQAPQQQQPPQQQPQSAQNIIET